MMTIDKPWVAPCPRCEGAGGFGSSIGVCGHCEGSGTNEYPRHPDTQNDEPLVTVTPDRSGRGIWV